MAIGTPPTIKIKELLNTGQLETDVHFPWYPTNAIITSAV